MVGEVFDSELFADEGCLLNETDAVVSELFVLGGLRTVPSGAIALGSLLLSGQLEATAEDDAHNAEHQDNKPDYEKHDAPDSVEEELNRGEALAIGRQVVVLLARVRTVCIDPGQARVDRMGWQVVARRALEVRRVVLERPHRTGFAGMQLVAFVAGGRLREAIGALSSVRQQSAPCSELAS